jgi:hypothetical protein
MYLRADCGRRRWLELSKDWEWHGSTARGMSDWGRRGEGFRVMAERVSHAKKQQGLEKRNRLLRAKYTRYHLLRAKATAVTARSDANRFFASDPISCSALLSPS